MDRSIPLTDTNSQEKLHVIQPYLIDRRNVFQHGSTVAFVVLVFMNYLKSLSKVLEHLQRRRERPLVGGCKTEFT